MRKHLLLAAAAAAIATPAVAQDAGPYIGIEGGVLFPQETDVDVVVFDGTTEIGRVDDAFGIDYKTGFDVDAIAGYDFGMFRLEGELGYKRAKLNGIDVDPLLLDIIEDELGEDVTQDDLDLDGRTTVWSGMLNGLVDFNLGGVGAYVGAGAGRANVKLSGGGDSDSDNAWAYQLLAGARFPVSSNVELGVKYRYFRTSRLDFDTQSDFDGEVFDTRLSGRFSSHSLLASLIFNFGAPAAAAPAYIPAAAPPPPPPPAPPATQTCPDGTVILATEMCPAPPPPPPPPPPTPERG